MTENVTPVTLLGERLAEAKAYHLAEAVAAYIAAEDVWDEARAEDRLRAIKLDLLMYGQDVLDVVSRMAQEMLK